MYNKILEIDDDKLIACYIECKSLKTATKRGVKVSDKMNDINMFYPKGQLGRGVMASTMSFKLNNYSLEFVGNYIRFCNH